jgi:hypothetical protein
MRLIFALIATTIAAAPIYAEVQRSSNPQGVQVQGNIDLKADQKNTTAIAIGEGNEAKNTAGAIKSGVQIQGNTKITTTQKNATSMAIGKNNKASNELGVIGGN